MALTTGEKMSLFVLFSTVSGLRFMMEGRRDDGPFQDLHGHGRPAANPNEFLTGLKMTLTKLGLGFNLDPSHWDATVDAGVTTLFVGAAAPNQSGSITTDPRQMAAALNMAFYDPTLGCPDGAQQLVISLMIVGVPDKP
jgi:hypothetical protein